MRSVTTIEGIAAADGALHPDAGGLQGMPWTAMRLLHDRHGHERARPRRPPPAGDEQKIREELEGNLCRCTGYHNIVKAVHQGAAAMAK